MGCIPTKVVEKGPRLAKESVARVASTQGSVCPSCDQVHDNDIHGTVTEVCPHSPLHAGYAGKVAKGQDVAECVSTFRTRYTNLEATLGEGREGIVTRGIPEF